MNKLATLTLFTAIALAQTACEMNIASKNNISGNQLMSNNPIGMGGLPPAAVGAPAAGLPVTAPVTPFKLASAPVQVPVGVLRLNDNPTAKPQSISTQEISTHHDRIQSRLRDLNYDGPAAVQPASVDIFDRAPTTVARAPDLKPASTSRAPASAPDPRPAPAPTPPQTALAQTNNPGASR